MASTPSRTVVFGSRRCRGRVLRGGCAWNMTRASGRADSDPHKRKRRVIRRGPRRRRRRTRRASHPSLSWSYTSTPRKPVVVALPTPPPSPYSEMSSAATNARHAPAAHPQCNPQLMFPPTSYSSSSAGFARPNQNGCSVGAVSCNHDKSNHQPQQCRCRRGLNVYCTRCKALCYSHGC